jgi:hypothetical protein
MEKLHSSVNSISLSAKKFGLNPLESREDMASSNHELDFFLDEGEDPINRLGFGIISYF